MPRPVLYVHHRPQASGAVRSLALLVEHLDRRFEPHVLLPPGGQAAEVLTAAGARVHEGPVSAFTHTWDVQYRGLRSLVLARELAMLPTHLRTLRHLLQEVRPALLHANDGVVLAAGRAAHRLGIPVIWHLRSSLGPGAVGGLVRRRLERWGRAAIAIDRDVARSYALSLPVSVVHNAVEPPAAATPVALPDGRFVVGHVGYLRRQKGWPVLLEAVRRVLDDGVDVHLLLVGGGIRPASYFGTPAGRLLARAAIVRDEESDVRAAVAGLGLAGRVTLLPFTLDTAPVYAACDAVVFANPGAGLGRPVLEAAAWGKPVVAAGSSDGAGVLLPGETGILLDRAAPDALAEALVRLARSPGLRACLGDRARAHAAEAFDPARSARAVAAVYDSVLRLSRT